MPGLFVDSNDALSAFSHYAVTLNRSLGVDGVLDGALTVLMSWPGIDAVCVYSGTVADGLHPVAQEARRGVVIYAIDLEPLAVDALQARQSTITLLPPDHPSGLGGVAAFPLIARGQTLGGLVLGRRGAGFESGVEVLSDAAALLSAAWLKAQQHQRTRHARKRLAVLHTTLTQIQRADSLRHKLQIIANALHNMGWGSVTLWLCERDLPMAEGGGFDVDDLVVTDVVYAGISRETEAGLRQAVPPGVEVYGRLSQELAPYRLGSGYLIPATGELLSGPWQAGDAVYIPLQSGPSKQRRVVGSIELRAPTGGQRPSQEQMSVVELFAHEAAHEIERARQADLQLQQLLDLTVLYETGSTIFSYRQESPVLTLLNRILADTIQANSVTFAEPDLENRIARRIVSHQSSGTAEPARPELPDTFPLTPELVQQVIRKRQPFVAYPKGQSLLYLPVALGQQFFGLFEIQIDRSEHSFAGRQMALGRSVANQAAIALSHLRLYQRTATERSRLRAILEASLDGIMLISPEASIVDLNGAACRLLRLAGEPQDWRGCSLLELFEALRSQAPAAAQAGLDELERVRQGDRSPGRGEFEVGDGSPLFVRYVIYPIQATRLQVAGWLLLLHDATEERALARMQDDLTHMLVHDLRAPLTSITSAVNLLSAGLLGHVPAEQQEMLDVIHHGSERMMDMVNNILSVASLETGQVPLALKLISPAELISQVAESLKPAAKAGQISLSVDLKPDLPFVRADWGMIERTLNNLVNNALKFTPSGGCVSLSARVEAETLLVSVRDTGPGIDPDLRDRLFQKFATGKLEGRGSGLGLAFCKLAVEAHDGRIWVESPAPARPPDSPPGSLFSFTLPLSA